MPTQLRAVPSHALVLIAALAGAACNTQTNTPVANLTPRSSDPTPLGPGCDQQNDPHCNNVISGVLIQMLRGSSLPILDENSADLCRRMAIDLVGRIPTADENTFCATATADQMADYFMGQPQYIVQQSRAWSDHFYSLDEQWYLYVVEIDAMLNQLFREQMRYNDFVTQLVVHPGFYERYQGDDWATNTVRIALGRPARQDEIDAMRPLQRIWTTRYFCDGIVWWNGLQDNDGREQGANLNCGRNEWAVNFCNCIDSAGDPSCQTSAFGAMVDFGTDGCAQPGDNADQNEANMLRVTNSAAGRVAICPDGTTLPQCADESFGDDNTQPSQISRLGQVSGDQLNRLYSLGHALTARPDFWAAAVNRELARFLPWWQNAINHPNNDVPAITPMLATLLQQTGSLKQLQRTIVTSLLYTQPSELPPGIVAPAPGMPQPPVWSFGPTRVLNAERWLDSASYVTFGAPAGICDYRFVAAGSDWSRDTDRRLIMPVPGTPPNMSYPQNYHDWAVGLGGCSSTLSRVVTSTLSIVSTQNYLAQQFCADGTAVLPAGFNTSDTSPANISTGVTYLYQRALGREPTADDMTAAQGDVAACLAAGAAPAMMSGPTGCTDAETSMRWFCERLLDSAEFAIF